MHSLCVDLKLLCDSGELVAIKRGDTSIPYLQTIFNPKDLFPPSLRNLSLTNVSSQLMSALVDHFRASLNLGNTDDKAAVALAAVQLMLTKFPLKSLTRLILGLVMEYWNSDSDDSEDEGAYELDEGVVYFLRSMADQLGNWGTRIEAYRMAGRFEEEKLLVCPGYTAPLPH